MSSDPIQTSYKKFHVPLDIESKFNDLYEMYIAAASEEN